MIQKKTLFEKTFFSIIEIIKALQLKNEFITIHKFKIETLQNQVSDLSSSGCFDNDVFKFEEKIYISENQIVYVEFLKHYHDDEPTKHFDVNKINKLLNHKYGGKKMIKNVKKYVNICDICQKTKAFKHCLYGEMQALSQSKNLGQEIIMDFITGFLFSKYQNNIYNTCLIIVNHFTKMILYISIIKKIITVDLKKIIFQKMILIYKTSTDIISNKKFVFMNFYGSDLCFHFKIKKHLSTAFHSQTNKKIERQNQILKHYLKTYVSNNQTNWAELLFLI